MFWNIDRIEEGIAVLISEEGKQYQLPADRLPQGAAEGDWGRLEGGIFLADPIETEKRRSRVRGLLDDLLG